ncbi:MAG TPA: aspartate aminotransferase family protein [Chloroflexota bacterium]
MTGNPSSYEEGRPGSARLYAEAEKVFPSGITHDSRYMTPFPLYIARAEGARKWDVDGNEYIDFVLGHGALLLGHSHPAVVEAVTRQIPLVTHPGGCTELEVEWGQLVQSLVPSAERVKFTSSGTEATMMAMKLARAFTGKGRIAKFAGHFHGWHDYAQVGQAPPFDVPPAGIPPEVAGTVVTLDPRDEAGVQRTLESDPSIAALILEPTGASWGTVPLRPGYLQWLRELTSRTGVVLIFDEVITGFRYSPGGAQQYFGVTPDLTTMAKILAGGLPGGAVAGRADIMEHLAFRAGDAQWNRFKKIPHPGTFNANPVSAAAGVAALKIAATGGPQTTAAQLGSALRSGMNRALARRGISGCVYGELSLFHIYLGECSQKDGCDHTMCTNDPAALKAARSGAKAEALRRFMLANGADIQGAGGMLSSAHTMADVEEGVEIFDRALGDMLEVGLI